MANKYQDYFFRLFKKLEDADFVEIKFDSNKKAMQWRRSMYRARGTKRGAFHVIKFSIKDNVVIATKDGVTAFDKAVNNALNS